jgi:hypothetical protein
MTNELKVKQIYPVAYIKQYRTYCNQFIWKIYSDDVERKILGKSEKSDKQAWKDAFNNIKK